MSWYDWRYRRLYDGQVTSKLCITLYHRIYLCCLCYCIHHSWWIKIFKRPTCADELLNTKWNAVTNVIVGSFVIYTIQNLEKEKIMDTEVGNYLQKNKTEIRIRGFLKCYALYKFTFYLLTYAKWGILCVHCWPPVPRNHRAYIIMKIFIHQRKHW